MNRTNILVISSCNGDRKYYPENIALAKDLDDIQSRQYKENELKDYKIKAHEMFISVQNKMILEGLNYINKNQSDIDICYLSSGYGLLNYNDYVIPYDINLSAMSMSELDKRSDFLRIHEEVYYKAKNYDLVIFMLGYEYLRTLKLPLKLEAKTKQIFFISPSDEKVLPDNNNIYLVKTGNEEASKYNITPSELKGFIFKNLCLESQHENVFSKIYDNPLYIEQLMKKYLKIPSNNQLNLFSEPEQLDLFNF